MALARICTKCLVEKPLEDFVKSARGLHGRRSDCKVCHRASVKDCRERRADREGIQRIGRDMSCQKCGQQCTRINGNQKYCPTCADEVERMLAKEANIRYRADNPRAVELARASTERYRLKNLEKTREYARERSKRPEVMERANARGRELRKKPDVAIHGRMSAGIRAALRERKAGRRWESIVGYSLEKLLVHLEKQFLPGMTWENFHQWEIDHIVPRSAFSFQDETDPEFVACWSLTNLRPMWTVDNRQKSAKILYLV